MMIESNSWLFASNYDDDDSEDHGDDNLNFMTEYDDDHSVEMTSW